jgi:hypothetical protein
VENRCLTLSKMVDRLHRQDRDETPRRKDSNPDSNRTVQSRLGITRMLIVRQFTGVLWVAPACLESSPIETALREAISPGFTRSISMNGHMLGQLLRRMAYLMQCQLADRSLCNICQLQAFLLAQYLGNDEDNASQVDRAWKHCGKKIIGLTRLTHARMP